MTDLQANERSTKPASMRVLWFTAAIVVVDQLTKLLIKGIPALDIEGYPLGFSKPLVGDILRMTYIENPGIAFGINFPALKIFFSLFSLVAAIGIYIYMKRHRNKLGAWEMLSLAFIMGGAIGNLIDRCFYGVFYGEESLFYGHVVDFLDFGYKKNWWPIFNVADSAVTIGVTILAVIMLFKKEPVTKVTSSSEPTIPIS